MKKILKKEGRLKRSDVVVVETSYRGENTLKNNNC